MFAIIKNGYIRDAWWAETLQEAQQDNPGCKVVECTLERGGFVLDSFYEGD